MNHSTAQHKKNTSIRRVIGNEKHKSSFTSNDCSSEKLLLLRLKKLFGFSLITGISAMIGGLIISDFNTIYLPTLAAYTFLLAIGMLALYWSIKRKGSMKTRLHTYIDFLVAVAGVGLIVNPNGLKLISNTPNDEMTFFTGCYTTAKLFLITQLISKRQKYLTTILLGFYFLRFSLIINYKSSPHVNQLPFGIDVIILLAMGTFYGYQSDKKRPESHAPREEKSNQQPHELVNDRFEVANSPKNEPLIHGSKLIDILVQSDLKESMIKPPIDFNKSAISHKETDSLRGTEAQTIKGVNFPLPSKPMSSQDSKQIFPTGFDSIDDSNVSPKMKPLMKSNSIASKQDRATKCSQMNNLAPEFEVSFAREIFDTMLHEIRTPLALSISLLTQIYENQSIPVIISEELLHPAIKAINYIENLSKNYATMNKAILNGEGSLLTPELRDLRTTLRNVADLYNFQLQKKKVDVLFDFSGPGDFEFATDHAKLAQIFSNLLANSLAFTFKGNIKVSAAIVNPESGDQARTCRIEIADTGSGMNEEQVTQINSEAAKFYPNSGLSISKKLLRLLGNDTLVISSLLFKGTTSCFEITEMCLTQDPLGHCKKLEELDGSNINNLPQKIAPKFEHFSEFSACLDSVSGSNTANISILANDERPFEDVPPTQAKHFIDVGTAQGKSFQAHSSNMDSYFTPRSKRQIIFDHNHCRCPKILIVDDDVLCANRLESFMDRLEISYETAFNGKQAYDLLTERENSRCGESCKNFSLVFLDTEMPIMDGYDTATQIKEAMNVGDLSRFPLVACIDYLDEDVTSQICQSGMDDHCLKPVTFEMLKQKLKYYGLIG